METTQHAVARMAHRLSGEGLQVRQIADRLAVPPLTVWEWLGDTGEDSTFAMMARMRDQGMTNADIARQLGVTRGHVQGVLGRQPRRGGMDDRRQVRMKPGTWPKVRAIAKSLGLLIGAGSNASDGSVGLLLDAIARGDLILTWREGAGPNTLG